MHVTFRPSQPPLQLWAQQLRVMPQPAPRPLLAPRGGRGPLKWTPSETTRCKRRSWQHHRSEYQEWTTKRRLNQWEGQRSWILTRSVGGNLNGYLVSTPSKYSMKTHNPIIDFQRLPLRAEGARVPGSQPLADSCLFTGTPAQQHQPKPHTQRPQHSLLQLVLQQEAFHTRLADKFISIPINSWKYNS